MNMKIQINGIVSNEALKKTLEEQKVKVETIDLFCRENKITNFSYKDAVLEYEYLYKPNNKKGDVKDDSKGNETR